jgi:hypothetical protein
MELTWLNKLRIAAVAALGILVIGVLAWPLAAPADPLSPVRASNIGPLGTFVLLLLALGLGFAGYFIAWPHGREIGILAVPFGLLIWAGRSGPVRILTQAAGEPHEREALALSLRFEAVYWLLLVAAGFAGVLLAQYLRALSREKSLWALGSFGALASAGPEGQEAPGESRPNFTTYVNCLLALAATVLISYFFVGVFVQDTGSFRDLAYPQPPIGQIIFGVIAAFAVAAFVVKKFTQFSYLWPILGSAFVLAFAQAIYYNPQSIRQWVETRPATFFPHSALTVLPVQFVALGTIGSIIGYWLAVRYDWWRQHESQA